MRAPTLFLALAIALSMTVVFAGCGGNARPAATTTTTPPPTTPTTPTSPTTPTAPPSGGGGSTSGTVQYQVTLHNANGPTFGATNLGQVTVNTNGDVTVQVTGLTGASSYPLSFCQYEVFTCFDNLATVAVDGSGNGQATFHFPSSGAWAGIFRLMNGSNTAAETSGTASTFNASPMQLEPISTTNGGKMLSSGAQNPGSGTVTASSGNIHVTLAGGVKSSMYSVSVCYMGGSSCYNSGSFTTDASGNASADVKNQSTTAVAVMRLTSASGTGLVTGFKVP